MKVLIAVDPCIMEDTEEPSLTVGKSYPIFHEDYSTITVIDDNSDEHEFIKEDLDAFFRQEQTYTREELKKAVHSAMYTSISNQPYNEGDFDKWFDKNYPQ